MILGNENGVVTFGKILVGIIAFLIGCWILASIAA
jgi:hypothetical protein